MSHMKNEIQNMPFENAILSPLRHALRNMSNSRLYVLDLQKQIDQLKGGKKYE